MKLLDPIPESVMVAVFLKAELHSVRFADKLKRVMQELGAIDSIIDTPNLDDSDENELRARVLGEYRGYKQNREIFTAFPENLKWYKAELAREEIGDLQYIDYSYWNELTDHTHLVKDAVKNIQRGKVVFDISNDRFLRASENIRQGDHSFEPMILWCKDKHSPTTILEGHLRATAFGLADGKAPEIIPVILGLSE